MPADRPGTSARRILQFLTRRGLVVPDPARGVSLPAPEGLPMPISTDRLRGLIDRAGTPMAKFVVALVAVHGLGRRETRYLLLPDLDLARGRLTVRRDLRHTVHLDELTRVLASGWLCDRHQRWPPTANPYLLVSRQTVADDRLPPISTMVMNDIFRPLGLTVSKLRQDRILDEARQTADPVHLLAIGTPTDLGRGHARALSTTNSSARAGWTRPASMVMIEYTATPARQMGLLR
ncbi:hypothetical protein [Streptomyces sp. NPDC059479]|uniref:hypothetical protein n=1 Tax=Streptomyces sp. NPDC059479 TaxID=3346848 RepID=UPI0036B70439